jgi:hypothetical protein
VGNLEDFKGLRMGSQRIIAILNSERENLPLEDVSEMWLKLERIHSHKD